MGRGLRHAPLLDRREKNEQGVAGLLELETVKAVYLTGSPMPELISPDTWNSDYLLTVQRTHGRKLQMDLFYDYRTNRGVVPPVAGVSENASAEDDHLLGSGRYLFYSSRRRVLFDRSAGRRNASPQRRSFRHGGLFTIHRCSHSRFSRETAVSRGQRKLDENARCNSAGSLSFRKRHMNTITGVRS
jgi:hypothetical protein